MSAVDIAVVATMGDAMTQTDDNDREQGSRLDPKWDSAGLVTAVVTDVTSGELLMVAHMNADALAQTLASGEAWFYSRSRERLWKKGESSGHVLSVRDIRIDCDQDALWLTVEPAGPACHTNARSCFYRRVSNDGQLERVD
jgi:phosphoribosyl-AMP cyclohydrolase